MRWVQGVIAESRGRARKHYLRAFWGGHFCPPFFIACRNEWYANFLSDCGHPIALYGQLWSYFAAQKRAQHRLFICRKEKS